MIFPHPAQMCWICGKTVAAEIRKTAASEREKIRHSRHSENSQPRQVIEDYGQQVRARLPSLRRSDWPSSVFQNCKTGPSPGAPVAMSVVDEPQAALALPGAGKREPTLRKTSANAAYALT